MQQSNDYRRLFLSCIVVAAAFYVLNAIGVKNYINQNLSKVLWINRPETYTIYAYIAYLLFVSLASERSFLKALAVFCSTFFSFEIAQRLALIGIEENLAWKNLALNLTLLFVLLGVIWSKIGGLRSWLVFFAAVTACLFSGILHMLHLVESLPKKELLKTAVSITR